jgi:ABC-type phosphate/phosphonate transport system substrate-binding protein
VTDAAVHAGGIASLGMYPLAEVRPAVERLWAYVHERCPGTPSQLDWDVDPHDAWVSPRLALAQTCGWPLVTRLRDRVRVVGAFAHTTPQAVGATYRSVVVARRAAPIESFRGASAAVNGTDSLSGWVSLVCAVEGVGTRWTGTVHHTGAHVESLRLLRDGGADIASIDSTTWALVGRHRPAWIDGLVQVGEGPQVPCLPVIVPASATDLQVDALRAAFASAFAELPDVGDALFVRGFEPRELADYLPLLALAPAT